LANKIGLKRFEVLVRVQSDYNSYGIIQIIPFFGKQTIIIDDTLLKEKDQKTPFTTDELIASNENQRI